MWLSKHSQNQANMPPVVVVAMPVACCGAGLTGKGRRARQAEKTLRGNGKGVGGV
jgi:hypothetical protein